MVSDSSVTLAPFPTHDGSSKLQRRILVASRAESDLAVNASSFDVQESGGMRAVAMRDAHIRTNGYQMPGDPNSAGKLFGGEVLRRIETIAVAAGAPVFGCGCRLRGGRSVAFWKSVRPTDLVRTDAVVVGIRNGVACVHGVVQLK